MVGDFVDPEAEVEIADTGGNHGEPALAGPPPARNGFDIGAFLNGAIGLAKQAGLTNGVNQTIPTTNANASKPASSPIARYLNGSNIWIILGVAGVVVFFVLRRKR